MWKYILALAALTTTVYSKGVCNDLHRDCANWAKKGHCSGPCLPSRAAATAAAPRGRRGRSASIAPQDPLRRRARSRAPRAARCR